MTDCPTVSAPSPYSRHLAERAARRKAQRAKHVYQRDERVVIVEPALFVRVGYPMGYHETRAQLEAAYGRQISDALQGLVHPTAAMGWPWHLTATWNSLYPHALHALTTAHLKHHRFGGRERTIHTRLDEAFRGKVGRVTGKRTVRTGTYSPGSPASDWEDDACPPELRDVRSHVILELDVYTEPAQEVFSCPETVEIEERHVRPVVNPDSCGDCDPCLGGRPDQCAVSPSIPLTSTPTTA